MANIVFKLKNIVDLYSGKGVSKEKVKSAEKQLGVEFAKEYYDYLIEFGIVAVNGHELTGICSSSRLNVVDVTLSERELNPLVPTDLYVIEQANIDSIVIWQSSNGDVYQSTLNTSPVKICESLCEYIDS